jgi:uncharacterized membrane protein
MLRWFLIVAAGLHLTFMVLELFPWGFPVLLCRLVTDKLGDASFSPAQLCFVSSIVHNAGIYNGIVGGGLAWAAFHETSSANIARVMLIGATVAGIFGALTLSPLTVVQAVVGIVGLLLLRKTGSA